MSMYLEKVLSTKAVFILVLAMSVASYGMDDPEKSSGTDVTGTANLPVDVVEHFKEHFDDVQGESGELLPGGEVQSESKDMDNDGKAELLLYDLNMCGSSGCSGPVYSEKDEDGSYCFVGMGDSGDFGDDLIVLEELKCQGYKEGAAIFLSDMKKFKRPN